MKSWCISLFTVMLISYAPMHNATAPHLTPSGKLHAEEQLLQPDTSAVPQMLFVAIYSLGPAWKADKPAHEQAHFKEHSANLKKLRTEKKIILGARYSDKGMIILQVTNEQEARAILEPDPMVANKVFNLELHPFSPFYKGCIE